MVPYIRWYHTCMYQKVVDPCKDPSRKERVIRAFCYGTIQYCTRSNADVWVITLAGLLQHKVCRMICGRACVSRLRFVFARVLFRRQPRAGRRVDGRQNANFSAVYVLRLGDNKAKKYSGTDRTYLQIMIPKIWGEEVERKMRATR